MLRRSCSGLQIQAGAGDPINKLPAELLLAIFERLKPLQQVLVLPQVCKRWHAITAGPSFEWPHLTLESKRHSGVHEYRSRPPRRQK